MNASPLVWVVVGLAGAVATIRWSRLVWVHRKELPVRVQPLALPVVGTAPLGLLVTLVGLVKALGAVGGESVDPSQKARILAEDASGATTWTAFGVAIWLAGAMGLLWLSRRRVRAPR